MALPIHFSDRGRQKPQNSVMAETISALELLSTHIKDEESIPLRFVQEEDLILLKQRGYDCYSRKAVDEAAIARIITGEINLNKLADTKIRVRYFSQQASHNRISIKVIDRKLATQKFVTETLPRDLQTLADLRFHPNIALPYDYFQSSMHIYLVSEMSHGVSLVAYLTGNGRKEITIRNIFYQICAALNHAHEHGIFHRNLTPGCIKINTGGNVKVQDFGLSPKLGTIQKFQLHERTKRAYMAPEVIKSRRYESKETDIYSAGIILYEMLHGNVPYVGLKNDILILIFLRDLKFCSTVQPAVQHLIREMLHPDPWKRPHAFDCLDHSWTCSPNQKTSARCKPTSISETTGPEWRAIKPSIPKYNSAEQLCARAQATVSCGSEKIVLRSRIPNKLMAYAMDMDYAEICAQLQSNADTRMEQNLNNMIKYPKPFCNSPLSTTIISSREKHASEKSCIATPPTFHTASQTQGKSSENRNSSNGGMDSILSVRPIKKAAEPTVSVEPCQELGNGDVFGSRPASAESEESVSAFDQGTSDTSDRTENRSKSLSEDIPDKIRGTLDTHTDSSEDPLDTSEVCQIQPDDSMEETLKGSHIPSESQQFIQELMTTKEVTEIKLGVPTKTSDEREMARAVVTRVSYRPERGSPVPSDIGSIEPMLNDDGCTETEKGGLTTLDEHADLPPITTAERVSKFLSDIPVCRSTLPAITQPNCIRPAQAPCKDVVNEKCSKTASSKMRKINHGMSNKLPHVDIVPGRCVNSKTSEGRLVLYQNTENEMGLEMPVYIKRLDPATITSPLCISHKQWSTKPITMQVRGKRAQPPTPQPVKAAENLASLPGPLYNFPVPMKPLRFTRMPRESLHSLLQVSAANVAQYSGLMPIHNRPTRPQNYKFHSHSAVLQMSQERAENQELSKSMLELKSAMETFSPVEGKRVRNFIRQEAKLPAAQLSFCPLLQKGHRYTGDRSAKDIRREVSQHCAMRTHI